MKYMLNRIWCLTVSKLSGFLTQMTPITVTKGYGQNNKTHRKVNLALAMTLYSQVHWDTSHLRLFHKPVSFSVSTLEADEGWWV